MKFSTSIGPCDAQFWALKAATMQSDFALKSWLKYLQYDPDLKLNNGVNQLMPMIYYNLVRRYHFYDTPHISTLKKFYIVAFVKNTQLLETTAETIKMLLGHNIDVILLKGGAFLSILYQNCGTRALGDMDILVPEVQFWQAAELLVKHNWQPQRSLNRYNMKKNSHAIQFFNKKGQSIDLHCHILHTACYENADEDYWQHAMPFNLLDINIKTLSITDHLIHICHHGLVNFNKIPNIRWVVDAYYLLQYHQPDWDRLVKLAKKKEISLQLIAALSYLKTHFDLDVSECHFEALRKIEVNQVRQKLFELSQEQHPLKQIMFNLYTFCGCYGNNLNFPGIRDYLMWTFACQHVRDLPYTVVKKIVRKLQDIINYYK